MGNHWIKHGNTKRADAITGAVIKRWRELMMKELRKFLDEAVTKKQVQDMIAAETDDLTEVVQKILNDADELRKKK